MCVGIALAYSELPLPLIDEYRLNERVDDRGGEKELRFYWQAVPALVPIWWNGKPHVVRWGNRDRTERKLPPSGWTWRETIEAGKWTALEPEPVSIPASYGLMNGVWFRVKQGMRGLLVRDRGGCPVVFVECQPSTRYFRVMTQSDWMPSLIDEVI